MHEDFIEAYAASALVELYDDWMSGLDLNKSFMHLPQDLKDYCEEAISFHRQIVDLGDTGFKGD